MAYVSEIERLERQFNDKPEQYFAPLADQYRKAGNIDLALDVLRANLEKRPNWVSAHIVLGRCYLDQKNDPEAAKAFEHILQLDAENIIALKFLGEISERLGDPEAAYRWVKRLLEVDPMNDDAQEALKRLEPAAAVMPAAPPQPAAPPLPLASAPTTEIAAVKSAPPEPAAGDAPAEPAAVSGFQPTSFEPAAPAATEAASAVTEPPAFERAEEPTIDLSSGAAQDIGIERSESAIETPAAATVELEPLSRIPEPPPPPPPPPSDELELAEDISLEPAPSAELALETSTEVGDLVPLDEPATEPSNSLPLVSYEPEPAGMATPAPRASASMRMPSNLPLIMPEDPPDAPAPLPPAAPAPPAAREEAGGSEPEPVITETMADVYLRQGLVAEAREVYRQLLQKRPDDAGLRARMEALEQRSAAARERPTPARAGRSLIAAETGGPSARSLLSDVLAARPVPAPKPGDGDGGEQLARGAPSRPTGAEFTLASVFGEEPAAAGPTAPPATPAAPSAAPAAAPGFSFDEFFGGKKVEPAAAPAPAPPPPPAEGEGNRDDFVSWLKGLKS